MSCIACVTILRDTVTTSWSADDICLLILNISCWSDILVLYVFVMICKKPSGHQRLLFLSYVTLNCYVITSDYSRVSSRVTRKKTYFIIRESLSRCCCFVSSKGNLPLKWLKFVFKEAYWTQTHYLALSRPKGQNCVLL